MRVRVCFGFAASSSDGLSPFPGCLVFREGSTGDSRIIPGFLSFFNEYPRTRNFLEFLGIPGPTPAPIEPALAHRFFTSKFRTN